MTTDTRAKESLSRGAGFVVGGMAKGSGMIHPNLATMLAVVTTDYPLEPGEAIDFLRPAVDASFNAISVDGECSTNDTVLLLANGASGVARTPASDAQFALCLRKVCADLARQIVADGEGATVLAEIAVRGAATEPEARAIAERVATSPLVKTALHRARRELGADRLRRRLGALAGRLRAARSRSSLDRHRRRAGARRRQPDRRRAGAEERALRDRARPRARERRGELSHDRPLARVRDDQRGVPLVIVSEGRRRVGRGGSSSAEPCVVVHGAGPQISEEMARRGLEPEFVGGRRVTTPAVLEIVRESFASVNAAVCTAIGPRAVPLYGEEIGLARGAGSPSSGWSGRPSRLRRPRSSPRSPQGSSRSSRPMAVGPLNVNADEMASALAVGLGAEKLLFLTDVPGVFHDGRLLESIDASRAEELVGDGSFEGGIVPKLLAAARAARGGLVAEIGSRRSSHERRDRERAAADVSARAGDVCRGRRRLARWTPTAVATSTSPPGSPSSGSGIGIPRRSPRRTRSSTSSGTRRTSSGRSRRPSSPRSSPSASAAPRRSSATPAPRRTRPR